MLHRLGASENIPQPTMSLPSIDKSELGHSKPAEWQSDHLKAIGFQAFPA
jgi:hypothetical protein